MKIQKQSLLLVLLSLLLSSCGTLWETDNTPPPSPLVPFKASIRPLKAWDARINFGMNHENIKFNPIVQDNQIIIVSQTGTLTGFNKLNGRILWKTELQANITSGLAANDQVLVVGCRNGEVIALSAQDRKVLWKAKTDSEILATPALSSNLVIIKSIDGRVSAFALHDGRLLWRHQEVEPNLILRMASTPQITHDAVVIGFANGKIEKLALKDGHEMWAETITQGEGAFAIQRMTDINADPLVKHDRVFAATYQGKVASLNLGSGRVYWDHSISTYSALSADENHLYISDAKGQIWAFDQRNGRVVWRQTQLEARKITAPVLVGSYLVVGDGEGVLHWLNAQDGSFAGRVQVSGTAILTKPSADHRTVYAITRDGYLTAYVVN